MTATAERLAPVAKHTNTDGDRIVIGDMIDRIKAELTALGQEALRIRDADRDRLKLVAEENVALRARAHSAHVVVAATTQDPPIEAFHVAMAEQAWRALGGLGNPPTTNVVSSPFGRGVVVERHLPVGFTESNGEMPTPWLPAATAALLVDFSAATGIAKDVRTLTIDDFKARRYGAVVAPR